MIAPAGLAWTFTGWFSVLGVGSFIMLVRGRSWPVRVSYLARAGMCVVMAMVPWSWAVLVPQIVRIMIFTVGALWYVSLAVFRPQVTVGPGSGHHRGPVLLWYHAATMVAVCWMSVVITMLSSDVGSPGRSGMSMAGMSMPGTPMSAMSMPGTGSMSSLWQLSSWAIVVTFGFVAVFAAAAVWFFVRLLSRPDRLDGDRVLPALVEVLLELGIAGGMGASYFLLT